MTKSITVELPVELFAELENLARALSFASPQEAAVAAIGDWTSRRKAEIEDRDPTQRYFINEALDQLLARKKT